MKLIRTLIYDGPEEWIKMCIDRRSIKGFLNCGHPDAGSESKTITELLYSDTELGIPEFRQRDRKLNG
jgi:hypothetical protein